MVATAAWSTAGARTNHAPHDPDLWHVAIAPGETKVLSLDQLDDLFRLEIIDASTRVWQPGMQDWLPLSVVAGIEDDEPPARAPSPPSARSHPAPPRPPAPAQSATAPLPLSAQPIWAMPAPVAAPAPIRAAQAAPAWPVFTAPESVRPLVLSDLPVPPLQEGGGAGRFLIGLALVACLGVTLYRNDTLREAARSIGQEQGYLRVEAALGSPGFGTPRAVEQLMASSLALPEPGMLPLATPPSAATTATTPSTPAPTAEPSTAAVTPPTTPPPAPAAADTTEREETAKEKPASDKPASLESLVAAKMSTKKSAPEAPARSRPRTESSPEPKKDLGFKGSSNKFDPLNGKL